MYHSSLYVWLKEKNTKSVSNPIQFFEFRHCVNSHIKHNVSFNQECFSKTLSNDVKSIASLYVCNFPFFEMFIIALNLHVPFIESIQNSIHSKLYFHNNTSKIHQNQNITKHSVQQKDKKVMEEKVGRPKRPDNSLPLLMPNYEQKQVH